MEITNGEGASFVMSSMFDRVTYPARGRSGGGDGLQGPPLNALRAFEAAARHESFSAAAEELHVAHGAISHQMKALEGWLGIPLFERRTRAVRLTEAGSVYLPVIEEAFNQIHGATTTLVRARRDAPLHVTTTPAFAVRWLAPRLGRLWQEHPDLDLRLHESSWMTDVGTVRMTPG